eukprot:TRINITY_DN20233_c0_g1_i2.p1 TRINITY_DN20233_c0_g1~~TRINITY_DN20233_c0_g1_i2.p1  ORF type:complete len:604 (+),score=90.84 TRINITY_DN20233_c0_g1_i2:45-1856(+)
MLPVSSERLGVLELDDAELHIPVEKELTDAEAREMAPILSLGSARAVASPGWGSSKKLKVIAALLLTCSACIVAVPLAVQSRHGLMSLLGLWTAPPMPTQKDQVEPYHRWEHDYHVQPGKLKHSLYKVYRNHPIFLTAKQILTGLVQYQTSHDCPMQELGVDLNKGYDLRSIPGITYAGICQKICTEDWGCVAWSWGLVRNAPEFSDVCFLERAAAIAGGIVRNNATGVVGGLPCNRYGHGFWWAWQKSDFYKLPAPAGASMVTDLGVIQCDEPLHHHCQDEHKECCAPLHLDKTAKCAGGLVPVRQAGFCNGSDDGKFTCCRSNSVSKPKNLMPSVHCVMLFLAYSSEQDLLVYQHKRQAGIFQCDSHAIYSSQVIQLAPGLVSRRIPHSMQAEIGGQFATVLNLGIFLALYRQLILDGDYLKTDWTIKVDPDTVFFPSRLRKSLSNYNFGLGDAGIYLNNCPDGLHGPIEVFSQRSFLALAENAQKCYELMDNKPCDLDCQAKRLVCIGNCTDWWGEDIWVDRCLDLYTNAKRMFSRHLLQEAHCVGTEEYSTHSWKSCKDPRTVAFHPFKAKDDWEECYRTVESIEKKTASDKLGRFVMK